MSSALTSSWWCQNQQEFNTRLSKGRNWLSLPRDIQCYRFTHSAKPLWLLCYSEWLHNHGTAPFSGLPSLHGCPFAFQVAPLSIHKWHLSPGFIEVGNGRKHLKFQWGKISSDLNFSLGYVVVNLRLICQTSFNSITEGKNILVEQTRRIITYSPLHMKHL